MMHQPPYYNPPPITQQPLADYSALSESPLPGSALLPSPPLHIPPALNRPRLKRAFSSSDPPLEPSLLGAIEESQWGEAQAERLEGGWADRPSWAASEAFEAMRGEGGLGLGAGIRMREEGEDRHESKRYKADITPQFASLSLHPSEGRTEGTEVEGVLSAGLALAGVSSDVHRNPCAHYDHDAPHLPPPMHLQHHQAPLTSFASPPMPTSARFAPPSPTRHAVTAPTPSPPRGFLLDDDGADASMAESPPRSPPRRPIASIPPPSPGAALRALPLAVERLRSPGLGGPAGSTEGKSLRRTSSLRRSSSLAPDPEYASSPAQSSSPNPSLDDVSMRPAQSSYDISPHRVYVASLDDSDDDDPSPARPSSPVVLPPGATGSYPLPPRPLPRHLLPSTLLPPGQGALTLYRPLTFGKAKEEAHAKGEQYDDFMRARQVEEVAGMGRSDRVGDAGMEEEITVGEAEGVRTPTSDGMDMDLDG